MKLRWMVGAASLAGFAGLAVVYRFPPSEHSFYPRCPFYAATHWLCPGCGSTRALYSLLHLDFQGALHDNALFTLAAPVAALWFGFCVYRVMRYDQFPRLEISRGVAVGMACVAVGFAIVRNILISF